MNNDVVVLLLGFVSVLVVVLLVIGRLIRRIRKSQLTQASEVKELTGFVSGRKNPAAADKSIEPPTFKVTAIGAKETGKTVFLASMFHHLNVERKSGGLRLTSKKDDVDLNRMLHGLEEGEWPAGTIESRSFVFELKKADIDQPILCFEYYDYAGEITDSRPDAEMGTQEREALMAPLNERIASAHALFGIIDGHRVARCLDGTDKERLYLKYTIGLMVDRLRDAKVPIYLILTKWDMLDAIAGHPDADQNARLEIVGKELLRQPSIKALVRECERGNRIIRLIPVSSVGRNFVEIDKGTGRMRRRENGKLQPINVEIPLYAILPDLFSQVEAGLSPVDKNLIDQKGRQLAQLASTQFANDAAKFLSSSAGTTLRNLIAQFLPGVSLVAEPLAYMFLDYAGREEKNNGQINDERRARREMAREFSRKVERLEEDFPASNLRELL